MTKSQFIAALYIRLKGLPQSDIDKSIEYYSEMIDDRMEDGIPEEEAVDAMGTIDDIVAQIYMNTPLPNLVKAKVKPKRTLKGWEIFLIILGSPFWVPMLFSLIMIVLSLYIVLWSLIVSLYAIVASFAVAAVCTLAAVVMAAYIEPVQIAMAVGLVLICIGLTILTLLLSNQVTKYVVIASKSVTRFIKSKFIKGSDMI